MSDPQMEAIEQGQQPAGVAAAEELHAAFERRRECQMGRHAWVPWLQLPNGSWTTWCSRAGCNHEESYDL